MAKENVEFGFGSVQYIKEIEEVPATSKVTGNVTINNSGSPGVEGHFLVTFMLTHEDVNCSSSPRNIFHWTTAVFGMSQDASYAEVEAEAARQIAPALRDLATGVEKLVREFDEKVLAKASHQDNDHHQVDP